MILRWISFLFSELPSVANGYCVFYNCGHEVEILALIMKINVLGMKTGPITEASYPPNILR